MSAAPAGSTRAPWHLWVVGGVSLLWNAMGAVDFVMTQTKNEAYLAGFTPEQLDYFLSFPVWVVATWAVATWGSFVGSLLLLLRKGMAVPVFLISFVAMVLTTVHNFVLSEGLEMMGGAGPLIFTALIFVVGLLLVFYARAQRRRGVLR